MSIQRWLNMPLRPASTASPVLRTVSRRPDRSSRKGPLLWYSPQHTVQTPVDPSAVLAHFTAPLRQVRAVSVSGVNNTTLRDEWKDCCATVPNSFDRAGQGYNAHPMFVLPESFQADTLPRMFAQRGDG